MTWPPAALSLRVSHPGRRGLRLWLPVFLAWPLLPVALVAVLVAALIKTPRDRRGEAWRRGVALAGPRMLALLCSLRGLEVDVLGPGDEEVHIVVR